MRRRGIVVEIGPAFAVVLTRDGEFCRVPIREGLSVGMEVEWDVVPLPRITERRSSRSWRGLWGAGRWARLGAVGLAACVAVGVLVFRLLTPQTADAWAVVALDGEAPVVLEVDHGLRVTAANSPDAKGQMLLRQVNLVGQPVTSAVRQWVETSATQRLLEPGGSVLVTAAPLTAGVDVDPLRADLQQSLQADPVIDLLHPRVFTLGVAPQVWQAAQNAHLSPGRLAAYLVARGEGYTGTMDGLTGSTLAHYLSQPQASQLARTLESTDVHEIESLLRTMASTVPATANKKNVPVSGRVNPSAGRDSNTAVAHPEHAHESPSPAYTGNPVAKRGTGSDKPAGHRGQEGDDAHTKSEHKQQHESEQKSQEKSHGAEVSVKIGDVTIEVPVGGVDAETVTGTAVNVTNKVLSGVGSAAGGVVNATGTGLHVVGSTVDGLTGGVAHTVGTVLGGRPEGWFKGSGHGK